MIDTGMLDPDSHDHATDDLYPIVVFINSNFGYGSYPCLINSDSTMTLPMGFVKELNLKEGDDIDWAFDEEGFTLYATVVRKTWEIPDWME